MIAPPESGPFGPVAEHPTEPDRPGRWSARHIYLHGGVAHTDAFLTECLAPAADRLAPNGWFFLRYWTGGPHVRVRLRDAEDGAWEELIGLCTSWLAAHPPQETELAPTEFYGSRAGAAEYGWHEHGAVVTADYEPELDRYGGPVALAAAEEFFVVSSHIAIAALRGTSAGPRRIGVAFNLFLTFARAVCDSDVAEVAMLRRYVYSARYNTTEAPDLDVGHLRATAERDYHVDAKRFRDAATKVDAVVSAQTGAGYLGVWANQAATYADELRRLAAAGQLGGYGSLWAVLLSQLHMLMNRIGITLAEEYHLSWLASLVRAGATLGEGFHDRGMQTPSRHFHEAAKYFSASLADQQPRSGTSPIQNPSRWQQDLALPTPITLPPVTMAEALDRRRSALTDYRGPMPAPELSALLAHSAGEQLVVQAPLPLRPYPTAGARHSSRVLLLPTNVPEIPPAIYEYRADGHCLRTQAPAPVAAQLAACSPYLSGSFDVEAVPLWLFVVGDVSAIGACYGARGYRFLLLEAGHLAQNLLLVSTALGYRSAPIGGFFDDQLSQLLDLDGVESAPFYLIPVGKPSGHDD